MKQETILKGYELLKQIDGVQKTKNHLESITRVDLNNNQSGTLMSVHPLAEPAIVNINNVNSDIIVLKEQIKEETIRFLQRCKRHCDDFEFKLKQELEDLA